MINIPMIVHQLGLTPHPEGGYYRRTYLNDLTGADRRGHASAIYYLLEGGKFARRHKLDADELWFWHAGAALTLEINPKGGAIETLMLGPDILKGELPQILVPRDHWQRARSEGDWTLVSCCVTPAFQFETFEMDTDQ
jgi:uncharacterized protein